MGSLTLPSAGEVYVDAQVVIYTTDKHPVYGPLCQPLWQAAKSGQLTVVSSALILLETSVGPLRDGDVTAQAIRASIWNQPDTRLSPISRGVLQEAARLRAANTAIKTPYALHAAPALLAGCALFLTNDLGFRRVQGLPLVILDDILNAS